VGVAAEVNGSMEYIVANFAQALPMSFLGIVVPFFFRKSIKGAIISGLIAAVSLPLLAIFTLGTQPDILLPSAIYGVLYGWGWAKIGVSKSNQSSNKNTNHSNSRRRGEETGAAINKDYYDILGVSPTVEPEALKAVYRALAKKYHPDTTAHTSTSETFRVIQKAYDVLSDPEMRERYDRDTGEDGGAGKKEYQEEENDLYTTPSAPPSMKIDKSLSTYEYIVVIAVAGWLASIVGSQIMKVFG
jgi:hypothetical protein